MKEWLQNGGHLPSCLKDFHDQKDIFKKIGNMIERSREKDPGDAYQLEGLNWRNTHIYTIDFFLWFMAKHGYTLQKSRQKFDFFDLDETLSEK